VGAVYEIEAWGNGTIQPANKQALSFRGQIGSTAMFTGAFGTTAFGTSAAFRWWASARVCFHAIGTAGQVQSQLAADQAETANISPGNGNFGRMQGSESTGTYAADTTRDLAFALQSQWGGSGQSMTCRTTIRRRVT
jgi:hypothetical protein